MEICFESVDKIKEFVKIVNRFHNCDFDLISGKMEIDAKSLLGILSLELGIPVQLVISEEEQEIYEALSMFRAERTQNA